MAIACCGGLLSETRKAGYQRAGGGNRIDSRAPEFLAPFVAGQDPPYVDCEVAEGGS